MKIIVHECIIEQAYTGAPSRWHKGDEVRIFISHIVSYEPVTIYHDFKHKKPKTASTLKDILRNNHFLFESPLEIDKLIEKENSEPKNK